MVTWKVENFPISVFFKAAAAIHAFTLQRVVKTVNKWQILVGHNVNRHTACWPISISCMVLFGRTSLIPWSHCNFFKPSTKPVGYHQAALLSSSLPCLGLSGSGGSQDHSSSWNAWKGGPTKESLLFSHAAAFEKFPPQVGSPSKAEYLLFWEQDPGHRASSNLSCNGWFAPANHRAWYFQSWRSFAGVFMDENENASACVMAFSSHLQKGNTFPCTFLCTQSAGVGWVMLIAVCIRWTVPLFLKGNFTFGWKHWRNLIFTLLLALQGMTERKEFGRGTALGWAQI